MTSLISWVMHHQDIMTLLENLYASTNDASDEPCKEVIAFGECLSDIPRYAELKEISKKYTDIVNEIFRNIKAPFRAKEIFNEDADGFYWKLQAIVELSEVFNKKDVQKTPTSLEANYQKLLAPFKNANVYYPPTLEEYLRFTKREIDTNQTVFKFTASIVDTLLKINDALFPDECSIIRRKFQHLLFAYNTKNLL